jgi:ferric-chelate reductase (NADPH)
VKDGIVSEARAPRMGRIEGTLSRLLARTVVVRETRDIGAHFRLLTLCGDSLRRVGWTPGQKVQVALGNWTYRTYTPMRWDEVGGSMQLLVFLHGEGPGESWARALRAGDACSMYGPSDSLDLEVIDRPALFFGDESSFALANAVRYTSRGPGGVRMLFEVDSVQAARAVLDTLGMAHAGLVQRCSDDAHFAALEETAARHVGGLGGTSVILSGKASSVQRMRKLLRGLGVPAARIKTRAYWAAGKTGLD